MKLLAFDLFCGDGGWTDGLLAADFRVIGFDLVRCPNFKGQLVIQDCMTLTSEMIRKADFIVASTPCEEFAVHGMKHFHPSPPYPVKGIALFEHTRQICEESGKPYVMENVRAAQKFVGKAVTHAGSFYLWGNAVPALLPIGKWFKGATQMRRDGRFPGAHIDELMYMDKQLRKRILARIPFPVALAVAKAGMQLCSAAMRSSGR